MILFKLPYTISLQACESLCTAAKPKCKGFILLPFGDYACVGLGHLGTSSVHLVKALSQLTTQPEAYKEGQSMLPICMKRMET